MSELPKAPEVPPYLVLGKRNRKRLEKVLIRLWGEAYSLADSCLERHPDWFNRRAIRWMRESLERAVEELRKIEETFDEGTPKKRGR